MGFLTTFKILAVAAALLIMTVSTSAHRVYTNQDLVAAATGDNDHHGRVQVKVYRGPTEYDGHDGFAPWGYWVKQPTDDH